MAKERRKTIIAERLAFEREHPEEKKKNRRKTMGPNTTTNVTKPVEVGDGGHATEKATS